MTYGISWRYTQIKGVNGVLHLETTQEELSSYDSLEAWGAKAFNDYLEKYSHYDGIFREGDLLGYHLSTGAITPTFIEMLSVFRTIKHRDEIDGGLNDKTKEKIEKLLNLSMSENKNEAEVASMMAYKLMKKHSINRDELNEQPIISLHFSPTGKRTATWEICLYSAICQSSGVLFTYTSGSKSKGLSPDIKASYHFMGRKSDVLNAEYVASCYIREIAKLTKDSKKRYGYSQKEANDYRLGLIDGINTKLKDDAKVFFSQKEKEGLYNIVPLDTRIDEARKLLITNVAKRNQRMVGGAYDVGTDEAKKIHLQKATATSTKKERLT